MSTESQPGGHGGGTSGELAARLAAARARLILDHPFLGALALRLPLTPAGAWCRSTASDGQRLYYNPQYLAQLTPAQLAFALAHEAMHCALGHFARRGRRSPRRWALACDLAINPLLVSEGLQPPADAVVLDLYAGMTAEEIYPCLEEQPEDDWAEEAQPGAEETGAGGTTGEGAGAPAEGVANERHAPGETEGEALPSRPDAAAAPPPRAARVADDRLRQWQRYTAAAAQRAREAGKFGGMLARAIETALAPHADWRTLLARFLSARARDDYRWSRPSRREGEALLPALHSTSGEIVVALDVSGSIADDVLVRFLSEVDALKAQLAARIWLLACDAALAPGSPWLFEPWETLALPSVLHGGGGTAFTPVFEWVIAAGLRPDALVYFSDGQGEFPSHAPDYPVLWLIKGPASVPWGWRVTLDDA